jgi:hypothetical protein
LDQVVLDFRSCRRDAFSMAELMVNGPVVFGKFTEFRDCQLPFVSGEGSSRLKQAARQVAP